MEFNKWWLIGVAVLLILLVTWTIWRNRSDKKSFEKDTIDSANTVEKEHKGPSI